MPFRKFICQVCGHEYDEAAGDPAAGLAYSRRLGVSGVRSSEIGFRARHGSGGVKTVVVVSGARPQTATRTSTSLSKVLSRLIRPHATMKSWVRLNSAGEYGSG